MIEANEYFDGQVKSLGYELAGGKSTVGVMEVGEYEFGTSQHETMTVIEGSLTVQLPAEEEWKTFNQLEVFEVDANKSFKVKTTTQTAYLCVYR